MANLSGCGTLIKHVPNSLGRKEMAAEQHLKDAPIVEALIDFRVNLPAEITLEVLKDITEALPPEYTDIEEKHRIRAEFKLKIEEGAPAQANIEQERAPFGFFCKTEDGKNIAQVRLDGFTFSELKPYSDWETFSQKAKLIWDLYQGKTGCDVIPRVAVRYINHMALPLAQGDEFEKYLKSPPTVPDTLPQLMSNFLKCVTISSPDEGINAHITQALMPPEEPGKVTVILDIDVFKDLGEDVVVDDIWPIFEALRKFKNDIFFSHITDEAKELFA